MNLVEYRYLKLDYLELMSDGDSEMMKTMLEMLLLELPEEISKMRTLFREQNWEELSKVSHKMKSTLAFVGWDSMSDLNKELELLAKNEQAPARMGEILDALDSMLGEVLPEIEDACHKI